MKIYIVVCDDRHSDLDLQAFTDKDKAISEARKMAKEYSNEGDYEEHDYDGFLFYANYSCEGDKVYVMWTELNET